MSESRDVVTRSEATDSVDQFEREFSERAEALEQDADDLETARQTLEALALSGTAEGADEVEGAVRDAGEVAGEQFDADDAELEQVQVDNEAYEGELKDRGEKVDSDVATIEAGEGKVQLDAAIERLRAAREAAQEDLTFLTELRERTRRGRDQSEQIQEALEQRVAQNRSR